MNAGTAGRTLDMTCGEFLAGHSEYMDGLTTPATSDRMAAHATACAACARYDRVVRRGVDLARDLPDALPSPDFEERLRHRIFHVVDAGALNAGAFDAGARGAGALHPRGFDQSRHAGAAVALGLAAAISLIAWSPLLLERRAERVPAAVEVADEGVRLDVVPWYPLTLPPPPPYQSSDMLAVFPGPYSPLVVTPPAHRSVRSVSTQNTID